MKLVDVAARNSKELATLQRKVKAWLKTNHGGCNVGDVTWDMSSDGKTHLLQIDNDGELGRDIIGVLQQSPNTHDVTNKEYKGSYDWASDTYARPASVLSFRF
jgi:hypothetical protein